MSTKNTQTLTGPVLTWCLFNHVRKFSNITLTYAQLKQWAKATAYNAETGKGEQRHSKDSHVKKLRKAMEDGEYTPTSFALGLRPKHRKSLTIDDKKQTFTLEFDPNERDGRLVNTDGNHRLTVLEGVEASWRKSLAETEDKEQKDIIEGWLENLNNLPIPVILHLDGDPQTDFTRLQLGLSVDSTHMLSLRGRKGELGDEVKSALGIAVELNNCENGPFEGLIRLDSKPVPSGSVLKPIPLSTLCARGASDLATSLVGLARIGNSFGMDAEGLSLMVGEAYGLLCDHAKDLQKQGKILQPPKMGGTKGSATLYVGLGLLLAYRTGYLGKKEPEKDDRDRLVEIARQTLDEEVDGDFSAQRKRALMAEFAREFLSDLEDDFHEGLPKNLLLELSASAFGVKELPKEQEAPKQKKASKKTKKVTVEEPTDELDFEQLEPTPEELEAAEAAG
jgi:hypothetical protein